ncbi:MAG: hypothetical protein V1777_04240 [Candidatus Micrarchaeota archaeon]
MVAKWLLFLKSVGICKGSRLAAQGQRKYFFFVLRISEKSPLANRLGFGVQELDI